jgi:hypothetical protein
VRQLITEAQPTEPNRRRPVDRNIHGMPLAAALGLGAPSLVNRAGFSPMVDGSRAALGVEMLCWRQGKKIL